MGKTPPLPAAWWRSLDALIAQRVTVVAGCARCGARTAVDVVALRERVGGGYSLMNRRCRCRVAGCGGWVRFASGGRGPMEWMVDQATLQRWIRDERRGGGGAGDRNGG